MRQIYSLLVYLVRPFAFALVLWRGLRNRAYWSGLDERFGFGWPTRLTGSIWIHAVSLGEVTAAAGLIRALVARYPEMPLVLTTATPTGRTRAHTLFGDVLFGKAVQVRFLPYDTPGSMRRFIARSRPRLAVIMETELWPNLFHQCGAAGIPIVLANARLSNKSVLRYRRFGALFRAVFAGNTFVAAQSADDAARFEAIGAPPARIQVTGNLKFDRPADEALLHRGQRLRSTLWATRPVWIAGSTHAGEEEVLLTAHADLRATVSNALLLLVPRHPERFQAVADLLNRRGVRFDLRSSDYPVRQDAPVLLVDTVGELASLYAAADVAFVGGSLVPVGGHNLLEPIAFGVPVITGPSYENGKEIAGLLLRGGAALEVANAAALTRTLQDLLTDPSRATRVGARGLHLMAANAGTLARLLDLIEPLLATHAAVP